MMQWHPTPVLLPGKSHGRRSLVGCSPWGREESDTTEQLHFHFSLACVGEGNGNPLQCSCLENPRDRGAWWAAVSGVAQSRTRQATQQQQQQQQNCHLTLLLLTFIVSVTKSIASVKIILFSLTAFKNVSLSFISLYALCFMLYFQQFHSDVVWYGLEFFCVFLLLVDC